MVYYIKYQNNKNNNTYNYTSFHSRTLLKTTILMNNNRPENCCQIKVDIRLNNNIKFYVQSSLHNHINIIIGCGASIKSFHIKYMTCIKITKIYKTFELIKNKYTNIH